jgi:hypothetical protein
MLKLLPALPPNSKCSISHYKQIVHLNLTNPSKGAGPTASGIKMRPYCLLLVLAVPVCLHALLQK